MLATLAFISSVALPPMTLDTTLMPELLIQAQQKTTTAPDLCRQLSSQFLQRELAERIFPVLSQNPGAYREANQRYRTRQQTIEAQLIQANCLWYLNQDGSADQLLLKTRTMAAEQHYPHLEAMALYALARQQQLTDTPQNGSNNYLVLLDQFIRKNTISNPQFIGLHLQLLHTAADIDNGNSEQAWKRLSQLATVDSSSLPVELQIAIQTLKADYYAHRHQDELALSLYSDAFTQAKSESMSLNMAQLAETISRLFERRGDLSQAMHYEEQACDEYQSLGNGEWLGRCLTQLAELNLQAGDANLALSLLFNALDIFRNINRPEALAELNLQIGKTYLQIGNPGVARAYLVAARNGFNINKNKQGELAVIIALGELYLQQKAPGLTIALLENALHDNSIQAESQPTLYLLLSRAYEQKGQIPTAYDFLKHYQQLTHDERDRRQKQERVAFKENLQQVSIQRERDDIERQKSSLLTEQTYYQTAIGSSAVLLLLAALLLWRLQRRQSAVRNHIQQLEARLVQAPFSQLPNQHQLALQLDELGQSLELAFAGDDVLPEDLHHTVLHFSVPAFRRLCERLGYAHSQQLQQQVCGQMQAQASNGEQLFQLGESRFLLLIPSAQDEGLSATGQATMWLDRLESILADLALADNVVMGVISFPFIPRCPLAVMGENIIELSLLAMSASEQIVEKTGRSSWVELSAIDCQQAAFFNGPFRVQARHAIDKGLVKVNALHNKNLIEWSGID